MSDEELRATLDHRLAFHTLGAGDVEVRVRVVVLAADIVLEGELDVATFDRVYAAGAFHLDGEERPVELVPDAPVRLALRLRAPIARRWSDAEAALEELLTDPASPLRHAEAWLATSVTQSRMVPDVPGATVEIGVRTSWARPFA